MPSADDPPSATMGETSPALAADLGTLEVEDVVALNRSLLAVAAGATSLAEAAQAICTSLHDSFRSDDGPNTALVRLYSTVRFGSLPDDLRAVAETDDGELDPGRACLTLLGTAGVEPDWCLPARSKSHRTIPLSDPAEVHEKTPMVGALLGQLGVDLETVLELRTEDTLALHHQDYGVFFVADARDGATIPDQEFVRRYGVRSVVGCGGALPSGELFALIVFSRVTVSRRAADLFRTVAYGIKAALMPNTFRAFPLAR